MLRALITAFSSFFLFAPFAFGAESEALPPFSHSIWSAVPPLLAITLAFVLREIYISLTLGVLIGATILAGFNPVEGFYQAFNVVFINQLSDKDHLRILFFTFFIAGFLAALRRSRAMWNMIESAGPLIAGPRGAMIATWAAGLIIFIDDYANSLVVGNTVRPITDKMRVSREKLSYLVDATAAPVASLAISTWVGTQIGLMQDAYKSIDPSVGGMSLYLFSLPFSFYCILTIFFVLFIAFSDRDFGPMATAERRARTTGEVLAPDANPMEDRESSALEGKDKNAPWWQAAISIAAMVVFIIAYILISGKTHAPQGADLKTILDNAQTSTGLLFGPMVGLLVFLAIGGWKSYSLGELIDTLIIGAKNVFVAAIILTLAWSMGDVCSQLGTAHYIIGLVGDSIWPYFIPALSFLLAAITAFSTGTSWGTMAIVFPIVTPLSYQVSVSYGLDAGLTNQIVMATLGSVLSGACLGDHISPISDTTLFSSMASAADHMHHVRTQLPYACAVGALALVFGYIPAGFGLPAWLSLVVGLAACFLIVRFWGQKNPSYSPSSS